MIGGDAAGMSAASQARRRRSVDELEIIAFEKSGWVSYSACGEPYHVAGLVDPIDALVARTPDQFAARDIDVRLHHEVMEIDVEKGHALVIDHRSGQRSTTGYDDLMIATGTDAATPDIEGSHLAGVHILRTLDDAISLRAAADDGPGTVVIVGGGYIGLETAEAFVERGWQTWMLTSGASVLTSTIDTDMGNDVVAAMLAMGIEVRTGERIRCFEGAAGRVGAVACGDDIIPTDIVVMGVGSRPVVTLAEGAGIPLGSTGAIAVDDHQRTSIDGVWSAGDCAEAFHRITEQAVNLHLGTIANKAGRVAGINLGGGEASFPGVLGTIITRVGSTEVAATGIRISEAAGSGFDAVEGTATGTTIAGYMPGAAPMKIRVVAEKHTTRLLGAQIVGGPGSGKRIDVFAAALWNEMTAAELAWADLSYAPPFSGTWDLIHIAARKAAETAV